MGAISETVLSNVLRVRKAERSAKNAADMAGRERRRLARTVQDNGLPACSIQSILEAAVPFDQDLWDIALTHPHVRIFAYLKPEQTKRLPDMWRVAKQLVDAGGLEWKSKVITFD